MDFWNKEDLQLALNRQRGMIDLWLQPPKISAELFPTYTKHGWARSVGYKNDENTTFGALRSYRLTGYWLGLLPVQGILGEDPAQLRFQWTSNAVYAVVITIAVFIAVIGYRIYTVIHYRVFGTIDAIAFIVGPLFWIIFTVRQATLLPGLIKKWVEVENEIKTMGHLPHLKTQLDVITFLNLAALFGLVVGFQVVCYQQVSLCSEDFATKIQLLIVSSCSRLFFVTDHTCSWGAPFFLLIEVYYRVIWTFSELTFMLFSFSLYQLYRLYNDHLERYRNKNMSEKFWYQMRIRYHSLSRLTKTLDHFLSPNTCVTFALNLFFTCFALYHAFMEPMNNGIITLYSIGYSIVRTLAVALLGSYIHDLSKKPLSVLFHVPTKSFCSEILRFQMEILADDICLTGSHFFSITRSFMVAVVGTIVTYEVVLLQFGSLRMETFNSTAFCYALSPYYLDARNMSSYEYQ